MKKITTFIVALVFTAAVALAIVNQAAQSHKVSGKHSYATIIPLPPPPPPPPPDDEEKKKDGGE